MPLGNGTAWYDNEWDLPASLSGDFVHPGKLSIPLRPSSMLTRGDSVHLCCENQRQWKQMFNGNIY